LQMEVKGETMENFMEVSKEEDNDWTYMQTSPPIVAFFIHTLSLFWPSKH
jgi:hypothetical protein